MSDPTLYIRPVNVLERGYACRRHPDRQATHRVATQRPGGRKVTRAFSCSECVLNYRHYGIIKRWPRKVLTSPA